MSRDFVKEAESLLDAYTANISRTATDCISFAVSRAEKLLKGLHVEIVFGMGSQHITLTVEEDVFDLQYWGDATFTLYGEGNVWVAGNADQADAPDDLFKVCEIIAEAVANVETITNHYRTGCPESVGV